VLRALEIHRITNVHLVPTMISALLALPEVQAADLSALRLLFYAASSMPAELLRRAMQSLPGCAFVQSYGSTEGGMVSVLDPQAHRQAREPAGEHLLLSCGKPCAQREVRIVGAAGAVLSSREIGEFEVRSPDMMLGYWNNADATAGVLQSGWLKTGDLGYADEEGYLYIVDRKNDMIITGGENVYPTEVEGVLYRDPAVQDAAVFGIPDPVWVEKVVAAVVLKPGASATEQEIIDRTRSRLAGYKCPKAVCFVSSLPKNGAGKVLRAELRRQFAQR
jgi:acyl-CoA synthetase (AMP-forming)/AMP-acid ligase II